MLFGSHFILVSGNLVSQSLASLFIGCLNGSLFSGNLVRLVQRRQYLLVNDCRRCRLVLLLFRLVFFFFLLLFRGSLVSLLLFLLLFLRLFLRIVCLQLVLLLFRLVFFFFLLLFRGSLVS